MKYTKRILIGFILIITLSLAQAITSHNFQSRVLLEGERLVEVEIPLEHLVDDLEHQEIFRGEMMYELLYHAEIGDEEEIEEYAGEFRAAEALFESDLDRTERLLRVSVRSDERYAEAAGYLDTIREASTYMFSQQDLALEAIQAGEPDRAFEIIHFEAFKEAEERFEIAIIELKQLEADETVGHIGYVKAMMQRLIQINLYLGLLSTLLVIVLVHYIRISIFPVIEAYRVSKGESSKKRRTSTKRRD